MDSLVQPAAATPIARVPEPCGVSGSTTPTSGLTAGVHYSISITPLEYEQLKLLCQELNITPAKEMEVAA